MLLNVENSNELAKCGNVVNKLEYEGRPTVMRDAKSSFLVVLMKFSVGGPLGPTE